jgi:hypothetical protein
MVNNLADMKKTMLRLAGLASVLALVVFVGAGCTGGADDTATPPKTGANATDNPSVGQPVTSGATTDESGVGSGKTPPDQRRTKSGG